MGKRVLTPEEETFYNNVIKAWSGMVNRKVASSAAQFTHGKKQGMVIRGIRSGHKHDEDKLTKSIKVKNDKHDGLIDYIGVAMERHGVFVQKGVGRGNTMENGFVVSGRRPTKDEALYAKNQNRALTKIHYNGKVTRKAVDWFNSVISANMNELSDKIAEMDADAVINYTKIYIR